MWLELPPLALHRTDRGTCPAPWQCIHANHPTPNKSRMSTKKTKLCWYKRLARCYNPVLSLDCNLPTSLLEFPTVCAVSTTFYLDTSLGLRRGKRKVIR